MTRCFEEMGTMTYTHVARVMGIAFLWTTIAHAQSSVNVPLVIDSENTVNYVDDVTDFSKLALNDFVTPPTAARNFTRSINIGDIVAINGSPARGSATAQFANLTMRTAPAPGQAIADVPSGALAQWTYTILTSDGNALGSILIQGLGFAPKPPGSAAAALAGDFAVIGGTGFFAGVRGQAAFAPLTLPIGRTASAGEDPAQRRTLGGGGYRLFVNLIVDRRPAILQWGDRPAITHLNGSRVTAENPAKSGEQLSAYAVGLGPTNPGVQPGQPFPSGEPLAVTAPIQISLNGINTSIISAVGQPRTVGTYRVDFTVPAGLGRGSAVIRWSVAWIPGIEASIPLD
jgi:hypothetical protein